MFSILHGNCLDKLREMPDNSVDAIQTDPPYGLSDHDTESVIECLKCWLDGKEYTPPKRGFMGAGWDNWVPSPILFKECLRVLKPGGHMLTFAGTRSMDLMSLSIRLAGFQLRDSIGYAHDPESAPLLAWVQGQGMPHGLDISKAIDAELGMEREVVGIAKGAGMSASIPEVGTFRDDNWVPKGPDLPITAPESELAKKYDGYNTALKPAWEPIILARKPLEGTVAKNVIKYGTGGLNIDDCRIEGEKAMKWETPRGGFWNTDSDAKANLVENDKGRYPANIILDGSEAVLELFPESAGQRGDLKGHNKKRLSPNGCFGEMPPAVDHLKRKDKGSAARFFYCGKANKQDRNEGMDMMIEVSDGFTQEQCDEINGITQNKHVTVKPLSLNRYLCRLITPANGVVLDPFCGSGSTGKAAILEGFSFIGIDQDKNNCLVSNKRCAKAVRDLASKTATPSQE